VQIPVPGRQLYAGAIQPVLESRSRCRQVLTPTYALFSSEGIDGTKTSRLDGRWFKPRARFGLWKRPDLDFVFLLRY
jgi:hypothetical protein